MFYEKTDCKNDNTAEFLAVSIANAMMEAEEEKIVDGCDNDPNDKCYSSETGALLATDCDPSFFWDTCSK